MGKFQRKVTWLYGSSVNWFGYKKTGVWGMYSENIRHHWFGIYGLIGFRYSISWESNY